MAYGSQIQCDIYNSSTVITIMSIINPIPRIDAYYFKDKFQLFPCT